MARTFSFHLALFLFFGAIVCLAMSASINNNKNGNNDGEEDVEIILAEYPIHHAPPREGGTKGGEREKRYIGWGRRPGSRYSKASSVFDLDHQFNKIYNRWDKRSEPAPRSTPTIDEEKLENVLAYLIEKQGRSNEEVRKRK